MATYSSSIAALLDFATFFVYAREEGDALNMADMFLRSIGEVAFALKQVRNCRLRRRSHLLVSISGLTATARSLAPPAPRWVCL